MYITQDLGIDSTAIEGFDTDMATELLGLEDSDHRCVVAVLLGYHSDNDSNTLQLRAKSRLKHNVHYLN